MKINKTREENGCNQMFLLTHVFETCFNSLKIEFPFTSSSCAKSEMKIIRNMLLKLLISALACSKTDITISKKNPLKLDQCFSIPHRNGIWKRILGYLFLDHPNLYIYSLSSSKLQQKVIEVIGCYTLEQLRFMCTLSIRLRRKMLAW